MWRWMRSASLCVLCILATGIAAQFSTAIAENEAQPPGLTEEARQTAALTDSLTVDPLLQETVTSEGLQAAGIVAEPPGLAAAMPDVDVPAHDPTAIRYRWQAYFGTIDSGAWSVLDAQQVGSVPRPLAQYPLGEFSGVGFPHIESSNRPAVKRYKPFSQMIAYRQIGDDASRNQPIPHLRCMGLSPKSVARRADRYHRTILSLAIEYEISASLVMAVITEESCFNPKAVSPAGAIGLMQLMPATAKWLKVRNPRNPEQNLRGGIRYLAMMREKFGNNELALAAYNAGPGSVRKYGGVPPFRETQGYVVRVQQHYRRYVAATRLASQR